MDPTTAIIIRPLSESDLADAARLLGILNPDTPPPLVRERLDIILTDHPHYLAHRCLRRG